MCTWIWIRITAAEQGANPRLWGTVHLLLQDLLFQQVRGNGWTVNTGAPALHLHHNMKELGQIVYTHNKVQIGQSNPVLQLHEFYAARNLSSPKPVCDKERKREERERTALTFLLGPNHFAHDLYATVPRKDGV